MISENQKSSIRNPQSFCYRPLTPVDKRNLPAKWKNDANQCDGSTYRLGRRLAGVDLSTTGPFPGNLVTNSPIEKRSGRGTLDTERRCDNRRRCDYVNRPLTNVDKRRLQKTTNIAAANHHLRTNTQRRIVVFHCFDSLVSNHRRLAGMTDVDRWAN